MKTHIVADELVCLKVGQKLVVELLLCQLPIQVFWVVLRGTRAQILQMFSIFVNWLTLSTVLLHYFAVFAALFTTTSNAVHPPKSM